ncbi:MAG: hypothetical protein JSW08_02150 [archaeon]|nr:MAG: hypothetical protein JSW08_02150 [archaeon]
MLNKKDKEFVISNYLGKPKECIKIIQSSNIPDYIKKLNNQFIEKALDPINSLKGIYIERLKRVAKEIKL